MENSDDPDRARRRLLTTLLAGGAVYSVPTIASLTVATPAAAQAQSSDDPNQSGDEPASSDDPSSSSDEPQSSSDETGGQPSVPGAQGNGPSKRPAAPGDGGRGRDTGRNPGRGNGPQSSSEASLRDEFGRFKNPGSGFA